MAFLSMLRNGLISDIFISINCFPLTMKRGQTAIEMLMLIGFFLIILIPLFFISVSITGASVKQQQADDAVTSLAKAADEVYALSPGTKKYVTVEIPGSVQDDMVEGNEIGLKTTDQGDIIAYTKAVVVGSIPTEKGRYHVEVEHLASGVVRIGTAPDDATPPTITYKSPSGYACNPITLRVNTDESSICKFDTVDVDYNSMANTMKGNALGHLYDNGVQNEGTYLYYVRCKDAFGNMMSSSEQISYTIEYVRC